MKYYSAHTNSFYDSTPAHEYNSMGILISDAVFNTLTLGVFNGGRIDCLGGNPILIPAEQVQKEHKNYLVQKVQTLMDEKAKLEGYSDLLSAVSYAEEPAVPLFQTEGLAFRRWRSLAWDATFSSIDSEPNVTWEVLLTRLPPFAPI